MLLAMKRTKISLLVLAGVAGLGVTALTQNQQPVPASVASGFNTIREDALRADLTFLASDALEGRMSLQTGDAVAIQWIASEFAKAGLQPAANGKHPSNQERIARIGGSATRAVPLPSQALVEDALHTPAAIVSDAVGKELLATAGATPSELQAGIDRDLKPQSRALPETQVTLHYRNSSVTTGRTYNLAGLLEGSDPKLKAETILFSGHHDHDGISGDQIWHGADDNGSGTVGVVRLAHAFAANASQGEKPKRSLLFVVFAAEERGLLGSFYMAAHPLRPLETTRAVVNFDMIGRNETESDQPKGLVE